MSKAIFKCGSLWEGVPRHFMSHSLEGELRSELNVIQALKIKSEEDTCPSLSVFRQSLVEHAGNFSTPLPVAAG